MPNSIIIFKRLHLKLRDGVFLLFGFLAFYALFNSSCANQGMPTGGAKDSIPPVVVKTVPELRSKNFQGDELRFTFNEFIISEEVKEKIVISPPMKKKPIVKMKGKTLIVEFAEDLKKETTYSIDFKDAIADNNEKNPIKSLRYSFSTGDQYDSLRIAGIVRNAYTQEPVEKALVMLHRQPNYTAFIDSVPDYIGMTDKKGIFMIDNIASGTYRLYALTDEDNSLTYNSNAELIAFSDSILIPSARFTAKNDTLVSGTDSLLVSGHVEFFPGLQYLMMFEEIKFDQFLESFERKQSNKCVFFFAESLSDSFSVQLIQPLPKNQKDWKFLENNLKKDSIIVWLTDTLLSESDTLKFELKYEVLDSLKQLTTKHDTVEAIYNFPKVPKLKRKKEEKEIVSTIDFKDNINTSGHDIYQKIIIEAPEPLAAFDTSMVRLYSQMDTVLTEIPIVVHRDSNSIRKFWIEHNWEPDTYYQFQIDSAAARNIYGDPTNKVIRKFKTQKEEYYGKIILEIKNLETPAIVQLLTNSKDEKILQKAQILEDGRIEFPYLKPEKYKMRLIRDNNKNGEWDTGYLAEFQQAERVVYYPKVIKVRSNFEFKETWKTNYDPTIKKEIVDEEFEKEKARKKELEKKNNAKINQ
jgi:hypothetical protein